MLYQTDSGFPEVIRKYGCYFMSLVRMAELKAKHELSVTEIMDLYFLCEKTEALGPECFIQNPDAIINRAFVKLNSNYEGIQIGVLEGEAHFWGWTGIWQVLEGNTARGKHFRLADHDGELVYDPRPETIVVSEERRIIYRVT